METPQSTPEEVTPEEQQEGDGGDGGNGGEGGDPAFDPSQAADDPPGAQQ
jgi:hypothetical protein